MASENETVADVLAEFGKNIELMRKCKCVGVSLWNCLKFKLRIEAAHRREVAELRDALKKAYDTLYSISCSRYGKGLTCTDDIHELVTMARECSDELYANENLRKALEGAK